MKKSKDIETTTPGVYPAKNDCDVVTIEFPSCCEATFSNKYAEGNVGITIEGVWDWDAEDLRELSRLLLHIAGHMFSGVYDVTRILK